MNEEERLDELLRALAHSARRKMVALAAQRPHSAGELGRATNLSAPATSEHLKVLRKTGLVHRRSEGQYRIYVSDQALVAEVVAALEHLNDSR